MLRCPCLEVLRQRVDEATEELLEYNKSILMNAKLSRCVLIISTST